MSYESIGEEMRNVKFIIIILIFVFFIASCSNHSVKLKVEPESVARGGKGSVLIKISAGGKWKITPESLISITYTAPQGITMDTNEFFTDKHEMNTVFRTGFKVGPDVSKGDAVIKAEVFFMMCSKSLCKMIKEEHEGSVLIR